MARTSQSSGFGRGLHEAQSSPLDPQKKRHRQMLIAGAVAAGLFVVYMILRNQNASSSQSGYSQADLQNAAAQAAQQQAAADQLDASSLYGGGGAGYGGGPGGFIQGPAGPTGRRGPRPNKKQVRHDINRWLAHHDPGGTKRHHHAHNHRPPSRGRGTRGGRR